MRPCKIRIPYISIYSDLRRGTRLCFFRHGGPDGARVLLAAATAVSICEASTTLDELLGRSGTKLFWRTKTVPHIDAGCVRRSTA